MIPANNIIIDNMVSQIISWGKSLFLSIAIILSSNLMICGAIRHRIIRGGILVDNGRFVDGDGLDGV